MPSTSRKQHNLMAMVANDPAAAKRVGVPQSVGREFMKADKGRKFGAGRSRPQQQAVNKQRTNQGSAELFSKGGDMKDMKKMAGGGITKAKMGAVRTAAPSKDGIASKGKTKGTQIKMSGSKPLGMKYGGKACK